MLETGICYILQPSIPVSRIPSHPSPLSRAAVPDDDVVARMKHHVQGVLANLSAMMPCFSLGGYKLPKVTGKKKSRAADSPSRVSLPPFGGEPALPLTPRHSLGQVLLSHPSPEHPGVPELSWVSSPPQFPTTTQKSPSTPASLSRRQPLGFQTAPSPPPSTPTTRDLSTPSLPEKVMPMAAPPLPGHPQPFWAARGQSCPVFNLGHPRDGCWAQAAIIFTPSFSCL